MGGLQDFQLRSAADQAHRRGLVIPRDNLNIKVVLMDDRRTAEFTWTDAACALTIPS